MGRIVEKLLNIVPIEETYFIHTDKPQAKLTKEIVFLNYSYLSPYTMDVIFNTDKNTLYIWFTKQKLPQKKIHIPEGFLWFRKFYAYNDVIIIIKKTEYFAFIIVKEKKIVGQIVKREFDKEKFISLLRKKYNLPFSLKVIETSDNADLSALSIKDIISFIPKISFDTQKAIEKAIEFSKIPLIVFFCMLNAGNLLYYKHINSELTEKKETLLTLQKNNTLIKKKYSFLEKEKSFWQSFKEKELSYPDTLTILNIIAKILLKHHGHINIFQKKGKNIMLWVSSESSSYIVKDFMKTGYFSDISILNVSQKKDKEIAQLELRLKKYDR